MRRFLHAVLPSLLSCALLAGCAGVEWDIRQARFKESFRGLLAGRDRGASAYWRMVSEHVTKPVGGARYRYLAPAHLSHFYVHRGVVGLGSTALPTPERFAFVTDKLLIVLRHDPTPAVRAAACRQLGELLGRLESEQGRTITTPPPAGPRADPQIHQVAEDLRALQRRLVAGERILQADVVDRMEALAALRPSSFVSAMQMVRALAARPVAGAAPGAVTTAAERLTPRLVADSIQIALRSTACGTDEADRPDPAPMVRLAAVRGLLVAPTAVARDAAARRLSGQPDPPERDALVRRALARSLGAAGGRASFDACVRVLDGDVDSGVRLLADEALRAMTGADEVEPTPAAWRAWLERHAGWAPDEAAPADEAPQPDAAADTAGPPPEGGGA